MYIQRAIVSSIEKDFFKGKVIVLLGARQEGKSKLIGMLPSCKNEQVL